jgi:hypothetical protein
VIHILRACVARRTQRGGEARRVDIAGLKKTYDGK